MSGRRARNLYIARKFVTSKRMLVVLISCAVFMVDRVRDLVRRAIGAPRPGTCVALLYHAVPPSHRERFAAQMQIASRIALPVRADFDGVLTAAQKHFVVTFDDALVSFAEVAMPELVKRGIPSALFVVSGRLGVLPDWRAFSKEEIPTERTLSANEILSLDDSVIVGAHTRTHPFLTEVDDATARNEVTSSRTDLQALLRRDVALFSFPYGEVDPRCTSYCREAGYTRVFTSFRDLAFSSPGEFVSGRVNVDACDWPLEFSLKVSGCYRWLASALRAKRALLRVIRPRLSTAHATAVPK